MTTADFYRIMRYGADDVLAPLYPAMPYTSFHLVTREDSDAILAYLMSLDPVDKAPPEDELAFPFDLRPLMFGWNLLFASREPFAPDPDRDAAWNRGAYLVRGLGHCGECHTPRNAVGALETDRALSGAVVGTFEAPDIRPDALAARGWNTDHLVTYLQTGASPEGSAFGEMFLVTKNSTRNLTHADLEAIATYLMNGAASDPSHGQREVARLGDAAHANAKGQALYLSNCSLCHGRDGGGQAGTMPALAGNSTVSQEDGTNLVRVIAHGLGAHATFEDSGYGPMPSYADRLEPGQITALVNYVRAAFATGPAASTPLTEAQVREALGSSN
jgi:mono/diheme cytochrome c family protein